MSNFYKVDVINISQTPDNTGGVYTGKITFEQLFTIHRLTERKESTQDPFGGKKKVNYQEVDDEEFQRHLSDRKLGQIKTYLEELLHTNTATVFPSAVIISLDINENNSDNLSYQEIENEYSPELNSCFLIENQLTPELKTLFIPKNKRICLIVDGQHRFYGLKRFYESAKPEIQSRINKFEFITTILIGFDPFQVGQVFANVNFHQKPVNRSLYYDIFGASSTDKNEIQLAHYLVLHLQNSLESPLEGMIKLLGKGYGLFSQAFLVEKMLIHFSTNGVWNELFNDFRSNGKKFLNIPDFIKMYFRSIEFNYDNCWPRKVERDGKLVYSSFEYDYILCKTTGMGAFLRLIKDVYPLMADLSHESQRKKLDNIFSKINKSTAEELFSKKSEYGGAGSEGLQLKLYNNLKYRLDL